jgi:uncharacterized protein YdcH (DUF465 family)
MQKQVTDFQTRLDELKSEHARLDARLKELERHLSLSPEEQVERARLKKAKLQLKDDIQHLSQQQHRA